MDKQKPIAKIEYMVSVGKISYLLFLDHEGKHLLQIGKLQAKEKKKPYSLTLEEGDYIVGGKD